MTAQMGSRQLRYSSCDTQSEQVPAATGRAAISGTAFAGGRKSQTWRIFIDTGGGNNRPAAVHLALRSALLLLLLLRLQHKELVICLQRERLACCAADLEPLRQASASRTSLSCQHLSSPGLLSFVDATYLSAAIIHAHAVSDRPAQ